MSVGARDPDDRMRAVNITQAGRGAFPLQHKANGEDQKKVCEHILFDILKAFLLRDHDQKLTRESLHRRLLAYAAAAAARAAHEGESHNPESPTLIFENVRGKGRKR